MGFLGRLGTSVAGSMAAKWAMGLTAAAVLAAVVAFGAFMFMKGGLATDAKWLKAVLNWERQQADENKTFDKHTEKQNQSFSEKLMENETKWRVNP